MGERLLPQGARAPRTRIRRCRARDARAPLPRRGLPLDDLADAARPDDELGGGHHRARHVADLQRPLRLAAAADPRRAAGRGLPAARVPPLSLLQRLAGPLPADGDRRLRADAARTRASTWTGSGTPCSPTTMRCRASISATGGRSDGGCGRTTPISFVIQAIAYYGKLAIHPLPAGTWSTFVGRAAVGPVPGWVVVLCGIAFHGSWIVLAWATLQVEKRHRARASVVTM